MLRDHLEAPNLLGSVLSRLQRATLERPRPVLIGGLLLTVLAVWLGSGVEYRSSRSELAPAGDPDQLRWEKLLQDYEARETVIACVEAVSSVGGSEAGLERFVDRLASQVSTDPLVGQVFHRIDVDWILAHGLYLLPPEIALRITDALEAESELFTALATSEDLAQLNRTLAGRMSPDGTGTVPAGAEDAIGLVGDFLEWQRVFLEQTPPGAGWLDPSAWSRLAGDRLRNGYLATHDGKTLFVLITPRSSDDRLTQRRALLDRLREHVATVSAVDPGFRVAFTGTPAITVEEMDTVRRDTWRTSILAVVGVSLLTLLVFRWKSHAALVLVALAAGIVWSLGAVRLELGYLNLITSAFVSTLVGVGVAYGIHPVSEYELLGAHTVDPVAAVRESYRRTGPAVAVAGLTTAAAFFSILFMQFRGFAELGLVAGVGVLLCLLSAMVLLPAILVTYGRRRHERDRKRREHSSATLDRWWLERFSGKICRFPRTTTAAAAVATVLLGWVAAGLEFNTNILELLPRNAESVRYQHRMTFDSDLSPVFNVVVADDLRQLEAMRDRAEREPSIARFESALQFLPDQPAAARARLGRWKEWLDTLQLEPAPRPIDRSTLVDSLRELERVLAEASEAAFTAGLGQLAGPLERARAEAEGCVRVAAAADEPAVARWNGGQERLYRGLTRTLAFLQRATAVEPPTPDTLPPDLHRRFFTASGKPLGLLYPVGSVFEPAELERYVAASVRVSEGTIGFPFMFHKMSNRITTGFYRAVAVGAAMVFVILLIDFRSVRHALLASAPLAIGMIWALGGLRLLGSSFNFANLVAIPLIVGVGIDNGVHVIHRVRLEGRDGMDVVLRHTGRAILISSLTTMIGFGSLSLASHRGLASLGLLLLLGVGSCLVASVVVLPNLLVVLGIVPSQRSRDT
jgi:hopanoid biosynthesis associated RND transporter like protein HpnN